MTIVNIFDAAREGDWDAFRKSCLDYAQEYSWRNGFMDIVTECESM